MKTREYECDWNEMFLNIWNIYWFEIVKQENLA